MPVGGAPVVIIPLILIPNTIVPLTITTTMNRVNNRVQIIPDLPMKTAMWLLPHP